MWVYSGGGWEISLFVSSCVGCSLSEFVSDNICHDAAGGWSFKCELIHQCIVFSFLSFKILVLVSFMWLLIVSLGDISQLANSQNSGRK